MLTIFFTIFFTSSQLFIKSMTSSLKYVCMYDEKAKNRNQRISNSPLHFPMGIHYRRVKTITMDFDLHC